MNRLTSLTGVIAVCILCILAAGCSLFNLNDTNGESTPLPGLQLEATGNARVSFRLRFPGSSSGQLLPNFLGATTPSVVAELILARPGVGGTFKFRQNAVVDETGTARLDFAGLPALPALGRIVVDGGHIQGWSLFHGAMDLKDGENLFELVPEGSKSATDLAATTMRALFETPELITSSPAGLASLIYTAVGQITDITSTSANSDIFNRSVEAIQPSSLTKLTISNDKKSLLAEKSSIQSWNLTIDQIFAQKSELATLLTGADITGVYRHPVSTQPGLIKVSTSSDDWQILAAIPADTGACASYIRVQGTITQVLLLSDGNIIVGGYDKIANCPFLAKWPAGQTLTISSAAAPAAGWQSFFTTFAATTAVTQPAIENIVFDTTAFLNVAVRNPADSLIRIFSIGYVDGSGATQPLNPTVTPNRFPSIELTAPAGNSVVSVGVPVTITASATELDTGDSIASVTFFAGNTKIGEVTAAPYTII